MPGPAGNLVHGAESQIGQGSAGRDTPHQLRSHHRCDLLHTPLPDRRGRQFRTAFPEHLVATPRGEGCHQMAWIADAQRQMLGPGGKAMGIGFGAMGQKSRRIGDVPEPGLIRQIKAAAQHHPQRFRRAAAPAGEQRIIGTHGAAPNDHGINAPAELVHPMPRWRAADPLAGAIGEGGAAIQAHGPLEDAKGSPRANAMQEGSVLLAGVLPQHPRDHLQTRIPQLADSATVHTGIGVLKSDHHASNASPEHGLTARGGAAVVAAGLQGDDQGAALGR